MIKKQKRTITEWRLTCDNCGKEFTDKTGNPYFLTQEEMLDIAEDTWLVFYSDRTLKPNMEFCCSACYKQYLERFNQNRHKKHKKQ